VLKLDKEPMYIILGILMSLSFTGSGVLEELKNGNKEFVENPNISTKERISLAEEQKPMATVLACSDSRVPPELIFNKDLGDLFIVRIAGNTVDQLSLASLEYGVKHLGTPLLIILGHQNCGAIKAAFELGETDFGANIGTLLSQIHPAIREAKEKYGNEPKDTQIQHAIHFNLNHTHREILWRSQVIRELVEEKKLMIQEAVYQIDSGKVDWY